MEITKEEVVHRLKTSGQLHTMEASDNWRLAFNLYNKRFGVKMKVEDMCSKCFQKVLDWLTGEK